MKEKFYVRIIKDNKILKEIETETDDEIFEIIRKYDIQEYKIESCLTDVKHLVFN